MIRNKWSLFFSIALYGTSLMAIAENQLLPIQWKVDPHWKDSRHNTKVVLINATVETRTYKDQIMFQMGGIGRNTSVGHRPTLPITLKGYTECYLNEGVVENPPDRDEQAAHSFSRYLLKDENGRSLMKDITDPNDPIYNGADYSTNALFAVDGISTCSAEGNSSCASGKWGSWTVGLANIGTHNVGSGSHVIKVDEVKIIKSSAWNNGDDIYYKDAWHDKPLALLLIEGTTDGKKPPYIDELIPDIQGIKNAPPCSSFASTK